MASHDLSLNNNFEKMNSPVDFIHCNNYEAFWE